MTTGDGSDLGHLDRCQTCQRTREWHEENHPMHPFNDGQAGAQAFLGDKKRRGDRDDRRDAKSPQRGAQTAEWPFDPVLRQALMDAGLITPDMLRAAEDKIRAVTGQFDEAVRRSREGNHADNG